MKKTKIFKSGNSKAIRIPKEFDLLEGDASIRRMGKSLVITPIANSWQAFDESLSEFSEDFLSDGRNQPEIQNRNF